MPCFSLGNAPERLGLLLMIYGVAVILVPEYERARSAKRTVSLSSRIKKPKKSLGILVRKEIFASARMRQHVKRGS